MRFGFILILIFINISLISQSKVSIFGLEEIDHKKVGDSNVKYGSLKKDLVELQNELISAGYLASSIDSVIMNDSLREAQVYFFLGNKYALTGVAIDSLGDVAIREMGLSNVLLNRKKYSLKVFVRTIEAILSYYENVGYPFVEVNIENADWERDTLIGELKTSLNNKVRFGDIKVKGDLELDEKVLGLMLGIEEGDIYSQDKLDRLEGYLKSFSFINMVKPTEYEFVNDECNVYLYLNEKNANFFNAILGVLPGDNGVVNITGDAKIKLVNTLNSGEQFKINWRKLLPLTQNLNLEVSFPYVLRSPVGVGGNFDLYKKDTSYIDIVSKIEAKYKFGQNLSFAGFYRNKSSNLLSTEKYQYVSKLPEFADIRNNEYGISGEWQNLDFLYNPSKGWLTEIEFSVGDKKIEKNSALNEELYEGLKLRSTQFYMKATIEKFVKLYKKNVLRVGLTGGWVLNDNLFLNELFRLGGLNTLRGFDEESIFASGFGLGTIEYRFLLEEFSNLFVFGEAMYYDQMLNDSYQNDVPYSFGAGINFQTKPGIFSVSYSLGSQQGNPLLLRTAKIHFGFVNYF